MHSASNASFRYWQPPGTQRGPFSIGVSLGQVPRHEPEVARCLITLLKRFCALVEQQRLVLFTAHSIMALLIHRINCLVAHISFPYSCYRPIVQIEWDYHNIACYIQSY
jgi:hypothetical protein